MRKEVKDANKSLGLAIVGLKKVSGKDSIPEITREKVTEVLVTLEQCSKTLEHIANSYV